MTRKSNQIVNHAHTHKLQRKHTHTHNLQRTHMSSTKHACGGTCWFDSQLLTAPTFRTKLHLSSSCSSNRLPRKWCVATWRWLFDTK
jgi:hypothetical protein